MFSTLRKGSTVYVLDRTNDPEVKVAYVDIVSMPRPMYPTYNPAASLGTNMQTVVDLTLRIDDEKKEFCVPSTLSLHTYGDYTLSETKEGMISEVDSLLKEAEDGIASIDKKKASVPIYKKILGELNPVYAKEQERDSRIDSLTQQMDGIQSALTRLEVLLTRHENN